MGSFGAVLATGISPVVSISLIMIFYCGRGKQGFHFRRGIPDGKTFGRISSLGVPSLITEVCTGLVILVFNMLMLRLEGNVGVAAYGVVVNISYVMVAMYTGLAQGTQPLLSRAYGRGQFGEMRQFLRYALGAAALISAAIYVVIGFFADPVAGIFNSENNVTMQAIGGARGAAVFLGGFLCGMQCASGGLFYRRQPAGSGSGHLSAAGNCDSGSDGCPHVRYLGRHGAVAVLPGYRGTGVCVCGHLLPAFREGERTRPR